MIVPPLVRRAEALAAAGGPCGALRTGDGALVHVLAARRGLERVGEIGTGCGVRAAWLVSALLPHVPFVTVEIDPSRAAVARRLFDGDEGVRVLEGDWREILPAEAPFDLLVVGVAGARDDPDAVLGLLAPGGTVVIGGLVASDRGPDAGSEPWLAHPAFASLVVGLGGDMQALVATRVR